MSGEPIVDQPPGASATGDGGQHAGRDAGAAPLYIASDLPDHRPHEILPGLWMGGTADDGTVDIPAPLTHLDEVTEFDAVVTLYAWAQPFGWGVEELRFGFPDGPIATADLGRVLRAATWAHERWSAGDRVLIRCQAGLNRSGLVSALVLMLSGMTPVDAIVLLRERRSRHVLCNPRFVGWLVTQGDAAIAGTRAAPADRPGQAPS